MRLVGFSPELNTGPWDVKLCDGAPDVLPCGSCGDTSSTVHYCTCGHLQCGSCLVQLLSKSYCSLCRKEVTTLEFRITVEFINRLKVKCYCGTEGSVPKVNQHMIQCLQASGGRVMNNARVEKFGKTYGKDEAAEMLKTENREDAVISQTQTQENICLERTKDIGHCRQRQNKCCGNAEIWQAKNSIYSTQIKEQGIKKPPSMAKVIGGKMEANKKLDLANSTSFQFLCDKISTHRKWTNRQYKTISGYECAVRVWFSHNSGLFVDLGRRTYLSSPFLFHDKKKIIFTLLTGDGIVIKKAVQEVSDGSFPVNHLGFLYSRFKLKDIQFEGDQSVIDKGKIRLYLELFE